MGARLKAACARPACAPRSTGPDRSPRLRIGLAASGWRDPAGGYVLEKYWPVGQELRAFSRLMGTAGSALQSIVGPLSCQKALCQQGVMSRLGSTGALRLLKPSGVSG